MKRDVIVYVEDILDFINDIERYIKNKQKDKFLKNEMVQDAIFRKIEIMGEAAKNIPTSFRNKYPSVPWKKIAGMKDVLIHAYFEVKLDRVWNVVKDDLPKLKKEIKKILEEESKEKK